MGNFLKHRPAINLPALFNRSVFNKIYLLLLIINAVIPESVFAAGEDESARLYTTREERREAGVKHPLTPWLTASGLGEIQWDWQNFHLDNLDHSDKFENTAANLQIGIFVFPLDWLNAEMITEYDTDINKWTLEEAELSIEYDAWELVIGKQFLSFGEFFSNFSNGPVLEFGETSDLALSLNYNHHDKLDVSASVYRGSVHEINSDNHLDWSVAIESWPTDYFSFGISYLSDLADSDAQLLGASNIRYARKVPAISGYLLYVADNYDISLEVLGALDSFRELDSDRDIPQAFNLEFAYSLTPKLDWAIRLEGSRELEDAPELQTGMALNYRLHQNAVVTLEALRGFFNDDLATDNNNNAYEHVDTLGALLTVSF